MKQFVRKIAALEEAMSAERGPFTFFALFLRESFTLKWDLLVAAPWLSRSRKEDLEYVIGVLQSNLTKKEFLELGRTIILDWDHPRMEEAFELADVEHGLVEVRDEDILGQTIKRGYIITSKRRQPLAA
ncbi:MAG: hypothetical protein HY681_11425 [Chloroflexi bacterium]|nr:hypothetical protein [Chloroflexota bacterium]